MIDDKDFGDFNEAEANDPAIDRAWAAMAPDKDVNAGERVRPVDESIPKKFGTPQVDMSLFAGFVPVAHDANVAEARIEDRPPKIEYVRKPEAVSENVVSFAASTITIMVYRTSAQAGRARKRPIGKSMSHVVDTFERQLQG